MIKAKIVLLLVGLGLTGCVSYVNTPIHNTDTKYVPSSKCEIKGSLSGIDYSVERGGLYYLASLDSDTGTIDRRVFMDSKKRIAYEVNEDNKFIGNVYFKGNRWFYKSNITGKCDLEFIKVDYE